MIKHIWSILCKKTITSEEDGTISLLEVIENLKISTESEFPKNEKFAIPAEFELVTFLTKTKGKEDKKIVIKSRILNDAREELGFSIQNLEIPGASDRIKNKIKMNGFPIKGRGNYIFEVWIGERVEELKLVAEIPVQVTLEVTHNKKQKFS